MFADRAKIYIRSGKGGDGHVSFRRESMSRTAVRMAVMAAAVAMSSLKLMKVLTHFRISDIAKNSLQKTENRAARDAAMEKMLKISF